jgi:hypothetical protein
LDRLLRRAETAPPAEAIEGHLPTFITIGTMKGGTSSLHSYLRAHPQIGMSRPKETDFFCRPDHGGHDLDWYRGLFSGPGEQFGESSPNYTKRHLFDGVVERIHAVLPDIRLIFAVRDPIERAVSHFQHNVAKGRVSRDQFHAYFEDFDNPTLLTSRYGYQLEPFVEAYGMERILVFASENLRDDRNATLERVFSFLGVDPEFRSPSFAKDHHVTSDKTTTVGEPLEQLVLPTRQREAIADHLRPDIDHFRAMVGQDFPRWSV